MLPERFGDFVFDVGANVYVRNIRHDSELMALNGEFGLGGSYNAENDTVTATIGPRDIPFQGVTGTVALYRILNTRTDFKLREIDFDSTVLRADGSVVAAFANTDEGLDLYLVAQLVLGSGKTMYSIAPVLIESARKPVVDPIYKPLVTRRMDGSDPTDGIVDATIVLNEAEMHDVLILDFENAEPVRYGNAVVSYTGGGNRYLTSAKGPVLQAQDSAPWSIPASVLVEPPGANLFPGYALTQSVFSVGANLVVSTADVSVSGFTQTFKRFQATNIEKRDQAWEVVFDAVAWDGDSISGSMFMSFTSSTATCNIGLRMFDSAGAQIHEVFSPVPAAALAVHCVTWTKPASATAVAGTVRLVVRVTGVNSGSTIGLVFGFPQVEASTGIGSRITTTKAQDLVLCTPSYTLDNSYGRFDIEISPNYSGLPGGYGPQIFFDTRDSSGLNGFWLGHLPDGVLQFGAADGVGHVLVRSASAIQLTEKHKITCFWDASNKNMRIDVDGSIAVDKNQTTITLPTVLNPIRFGTRYDGSNRGSFQLYTFTHTQTQD
jgi:hypothetical protein